MAEEIKITEDQNTVEIGSKKFVFVSTGDPTDMACESCDLKSYCHNGLEESFPCLTSTLDDVSRIDQQTGIFKLSEN